jgi:hypothetical protein
MGPYGTNGQHVIVAHPGKVTRPDGSPVSLLDYSDYPAVGECMVCHNPIHCDVWLKSPWLHTEVPATIAAGTA